jgi:hypothetical protein
MPQETVNTDSLRVTKDEALEFMAHHLKLAALFFEVVGDPAGLETDPYRAELARLLEKGEPRHDAGLAFYDSLVATYEAMKADD